jgi:N-methylhydantoinase A
MMVNLRLSALGRLENSLPLDSASRDEDRGIRGQRPVIFENKPVGCPIYLRSGFKSGDQLDGPAVIEEVGATILVYAGDKMQVNDFGHLVIEVMNP